jgi:hypothetical protein
VRNDADSHELLAVVTAVHHQRVGETLNDGAVGLAEPLDGIATSGVRNVDGRPDLDIVAAEVKTVSLLQASSAAWPFARKSAKSKSPLSSGRLTSMRYHGSRHPRSSIGL